VHRPAAPGAPLTRARLRSPALCAASPLRDLGPSATVAQRARPGRFAGAGPVADALAVGRIADAEAHFQVVTRIEVFAVVVAQGAFRDVALHRRLGQLIRAHRGVDFVGNRVARVVPIEGELAISLHVGAGNAFLGLPAYRARPTAAPTQLGVFV